MISAEVIRDSISPAGHRLTTFKLRYPKFVHGEFMTHRALSRNGAWHVVPVAKNGEDGVVGERLDAIKYLRAKGYKIDRLAGGWFQLNGQRTPKAVVVGLVDKERDRVDLPKIDASKVF